MALEDPMPHVSTKNSSLIERPNYDKWMRSDKVGLKIITDSISKSIRGSIKMMEHAKDDLDAIRGQFEVTDKALGTSLMN